jgi:hypothetical protein
MRFRKCRDCTENGVCGIQEQVIQDASCEDEAQAMIEVCDGPFKEEDDPEWTDEDEFTG